VQRPETDASLAAPIRTTRLELVLIPEAVLRAMADDGTDAVEWPGVGEIAAELVATLPSALRLRQVEADSAVAPWLVRGIVLRDPPAPTGPRIVGHIGGHDRPDAAGIVEAGYTVAEADRRRGYATEGAAGWFAWAHAHGARRARLSTTADNPASQAVIARLGLMPVDRVWDEDDQVWEDVFEADLPLV
jgi:RimJ/RimL family protein N-acetyltransferase